MNSQRLIIAILLFFFFSVSSFAQQYSAFTSYAWDNWEKNQWAYVYSGGWCYAVPGESDYYSKRIKPTGNAKDFYWRFNIQDLGLHEQSRKEWKSLKKQGGWLETICTIEYYISDEYQTLESQLKSHSWPCAKYYVKSNKPTKLVSTKAKARVHFTDDDEVRTINFLIDGLGFAISVHWDYSGYRMTYTY